MSTFLIREEAQQDMDLKSAFALAVPRQLFFRATLGDPSKAQGEQQRTRERRTLLPQSSGLRALHAWYMPHEVPEVFTHSSITAEVFAKSTQSGLPTLSVKCRWDAPGFDRKV